MDKYAYNEQEVLKTVDSAYSRLLPPLDETMKNADAVELYLVSKYDFRYNLVRGSVEYKTKGESEYSRLTDRAINSLVRELKFEGLKMHKNKLVELLESDFTQVFHPMLDYLEGLPEWDGETDHLTEVAKMVSTDDDSFFVDTFKRWFVAMIACAIRPEVTNQWALIFSGGQGIGKSTFIRKLLPKELQDYQYSGMIDPKSKDSLIYLAECFIIDLDELSNLTKKSNEEVKEIITKAKVKVRRPYGRVVEDLPRCASFIGSVNEDQFLTDTTGNRRYLCFRVNRIDYLAPINHGGVYSQAFALLKSGFKYHFDHEDNIKLNERNEKFRQRGLLEDLLENYKPAVNLRDADLYMSAGEFLHHLSEQYKVPLDERNNVRLGKLLVQLGFRKTKRRAKWVYAIDIKSESDYNEQGVLPLSA